MNVLVLTPVYPHHASPAEGLFNQQHARALAQGGVEVTVVVAKPWLPDTLARVSRRYRHLFDLPAREDQNGIPVVFARYLHVPQYRLPQLTVASCARAVLGALSRQPRGQRFDVVQVHSSWPVGLAAPEVARSLGCGYALTLHIEDDPRLLAGPAAALYRRMIKGARAVVAVGSPLVRFMQSVAPGTPIHVVPNGVELDGVALRPPERAGAGGPRLVSVANLWEQKGIDLNLRALAQLAGEGVRWQSYTVVGDGPERPALYRLAAELGIAGRVRFCGRLPHRQALDEVAGADVFTLPSWREAFGVAYLEAMALGLPAVGCRGQGAEDIIRDGVDGFLVAPRDVAELAAALRRLLGDPASARQMGERARLRAGEFTWTRNRARYLELYEAMCAR
jgi:glycosyltransferase involved in cell wall biosynthesis